MPRNYVDNAMNRSLGRVGLPVGSAVHSRSSGGGGSYSSGYSTGACSYGSASTYTAGISASFSVSSSGSSSKTYVDNAMNRRLGRVGMEHGTAPHSKTGSSASSYSSIASSGTVKDVYVDNSLNRKLGRVGLEHGTAVHSKSSGSTSSSSSRSSAGTAKDVYVDNALNRKLGRVGLEHGTAVHSSGQVEVYKDNALNRKLGRVGKPLGSMPYNSRKGQAAFNQTNSKKSMPGRVYVDNAYNRKHNRVGLPLGSRPIPRKVGVYEDSPLNRALDRVGEPWGTCKVTKSTRAQILRKLRQSRDDEIPDDIVNEYDIADEVQRDEMEHGIEMRNLEREVERWLEENEQWDCHAHTAHEMITSCADYRLDYESLELRERIGHGGFGEVYFAVLDGEPVAVKKLRVQQMTKKRQSQFEQEFKVYCKLEHPNIVRFIGACVEGPNFAIVMELMDMSLFDALHVKQVDISNSSKLQIMRDVTNGLAYLHKESVAHCDLKTQNVLLNNVHGEPHSDDSKPVLAKITDFGLSKMKSDMDTSTSRPAPPPLGTPRYSAPEVLCGELLSVKQLMISDVYSLGLVILELAIEEIAFEDLTLEQLKLHVGQKGLKPSLPQTVRLNRQVEANLVACWKSPPERPSARDMASVAGSVETLFVEREE